MCCPQYGKARGDRIEVAGWGERERGNLVQNGVLQIFRVRNRESFIRRTGNLKNCGSR